ncbi:MAG: hypothetical protein P8100_09820 [bacterium]
MIDYKGNPDDLWVKAAVVGGLWASVEIIVGSFLHNARIPMAGSLLAIFSTILMIGFYQVWPQKGLIIRAGLITAIMKSVSPSAFILGPMTGIMMEAILVELMVYLFGNNLFGLILAGIASVSSALLHKLVNLLIFYGFDLIKVYVNMVNFALKQLGLEEAAPLQILLVLFALYTILGMIAALAGYYIGQRSMHLKDREHDFGSITLTEDKFDFFQVDKDSRKFISLLLVHLTAIPLGLFLLNSLEGYRAYLFMAVYVLVFGYYYRHSMRRLRKPVFWIQLVIIVILSSFFWEIQETRSSWFSSEGLFVGLDMVFRAIFIVTAFTGISVELHNEKVRDFLFQTGFEKFYHAVGMAFGALPLMISLLPSSREILRNPSKSLLKPLVMADQWLEVFRKR